MSPPDSLQRYFEALERLKAGKPIRVAAGGRITNDAVSLEAGKGKGSIKKSRKIYHELIESITKAENEKNLQSETFQLKNKLLKAKDEISKLKAERDHILSELLSRHYELFEIKKRKK